MIHYTCDRCKREIDPTEQARYIVQIDIRPVREESFAQFADEVDHLHELHEMLETVHHNDNGYQLNDVAASEEVTQPGPFDLCPACYQQFLKNPLGRETSFALGFSNN